MHHRTGRLYHAADLLRIVTERVYLFFRDGPAQVQVNQGLVEKAHPVLSARAYRVGDLECFTFPDQVFHRRCTQHDFHRGHPSPAIHPGNEALAEYAVQHAGQPALG